MSVETCCAGCGLPAPVHYYCDEQPGEGPWCGDCFEQQCVREHDAGWMTQVFEGG